MSPSIKRVSPATMGSVKVSIIKLPSTSDVRGSTVEGPVMLRVKLVVGEVLGTSVNSSLSTKGSV